MVAALWVTMHWCALIGIPGVEKSSAIFFNINIVIILLFFIINIAIIMLLFKFLAHAV